MEPLTKDRRDVISALPAVSAVTERRITYRAEFKRWAIARYREGYRPVEIFRAAGLDPVLVGRKRIERCFARWRERAGVPAHGPDDMKPLPPIGRFAVLVVTVRMTSGEYEAWKAWKGERDDRGNA